MVQSSPLMEVSCKRKAKNVRNKRQRSRLRGMSRQIHMWRMPRESLQLFQWRRNSRRHRMHKKRGTMESRGKNAAYLKPSSLSEALKNKRVRLVHVEAICCCSSSSFPCVPLLYALQVLLWFQTSYRNIHTSSWIHTFKFLNFPFY